MTAALTRSNCEATF